MRINHGNFKLEVDPSGLSNLDGPELQVNKAWRLRKDLTWAPVSAQVVRLLEERDLPAILEEAILVRAQLLSEAEDTAVDQALDRARGL